MPVEGLLARGPLLLPPCAFPRLADTSGRPATSVELLPWLPVECGDGAGADVSLTGAALRAFAADDMHLGRNVVTNIEVLALGYTWATSHPTIFHAAEYSMGFSIAVHTIGHLVGGLTWEPLFGFLIMEMIWFIYSRGRSVLQARATSV